MEIFFYLMQIRFLNDKNSQNNASQVSERSIYAIFNASKKLQIKKLLMFYNESILDLKYSFELFFSLNILTIQRLKKLISQMIWANREMVPFIGESVTYYD